MSHLSHDELLAAAEGRAARAEHLSACPACRLEVEALAEVWREVASAPVPEPSPLFWEHFSAAVHARIADQKVGSNVKVGGETKVGARWWRLVVPAAAAVVLLVAGGRLLTRGPSAPAAPPAARGASAAVVAAPPPVSVEQGLAADDSWGAFAAVASEADPTGEAFRTPAPGLADGALLQMTDEERGELIRLLKDEIARRGARSEG